MERETCARVRAGAVETKAEAQVYRSCASHFTSLDGDTPRFLFLMRCSCKGGHPIPGRWMGISGVWLETGNKARQIAIVITWGSHAILGKLMRTAGRRKPQDKRRGLGRGSDHNQAQAKRAMPKSRGRVKGGSQEGESRVSQAPAKRACISTMMSGCSPPISPDSSGQIN